METTAELRQKGYTNKIIIITGDLNLVTSDDSIPKGWLINLNMKLKYHYFHVFRQWMSYLASQLQVIK